jgi:hypothetical protein
MDRTRSSRYGSRVLDFLVVQRHDLLQLSWALANWIPGTRIGLVVEPDPGSGTVAVPFAPDAHTDGHGAGSFATHMPRPGLYSYTLIIERAEAYETRTTVVRVI